MSDAHPLRDWFARRGWSPFAFQEEVWAAYEAGKSGLIHSATGTGKTLAAWGGPLADLVREPGEGVRVLWMTPLRALAADTADSLNGPLADLGLDWRVGMRTGDTSGAEKTKQLRRLPPALVTTPESLTLMLSREDAPELFQHLDAVVCDEWHELLSSKRGTQAELALARLRSFRPELRTWGVSATLGNLKEAGQALVGVDRPCHVVRGYADKEVVIDSILPDRMDRFPWAGHFGTRMVGPVVRAIEESGSTLVFCNTRAQSEIWFQLILEARPEWKEGVGLHHGSMDREVREEVEQGLKEGKLRAVVCTSSLDLGVDFTPVDRVIQIGSPKGVARLLQRAGRAGHQPGVPSRVTCVPTHAIELVDLASARDAALAGKIESRRPLRNPLDVLAQHLVTVAAGTGFDEEEMKAEVRRTVAFHHLSEEEWGWTMEFVTQGGQSLRAYPEYRRVERGADGRWRVLQAEIARRHRMSVGTITSEAAMTVRYVQGSVLGTVEEGFLSRLRPGDRFLFAGRSLEFMRIKDMTAWVRRSTTVEGATPRWSGGRLPLSGELAQAVRDTLDRAKDGELDSPETRALQPILSLQARWSAIPARDELLVEYVEDKEGCHLFLYPLEGRLVHEGLAAVLALRMSRQRPITFTTACNDYGLELLSAEPPPFEEALECGLFSPEGIAEDVLASLNAVEMAKRQFREIARVAGLVFPGFPGMGKSAKQVQASSGLFFDVFARYDPENLLYRQAFREVLERQLEESRLMEVLSRMQGAKLVVKNPPRPTPLSFPILVDRLRETVTSEPLADRIARITAELEAVAGVG